MSPSHVAFVVSASAPIAAPADRVYRMLADYRVGRPSLLPKHVGPLVVEEGGVGAGTKILASVRMMGRMRSFRAVVSEPDPGRVLVETNLDSPPSVTTFTVDRRGERAAHVTISTEVQVRSGPLGALERFMVRRFLMPIYASELKLLADRAVQSPA